MTKADLVSIIVRETGQQKANVIATVDAFFDVAKTSLTQGDTLYLRGFGNFKIKHRPKRMARNIQKNEAIVIEAYDYPSFKPCKEFIDQVKNGEGGKNDLFRTSNW